MSRFSKYFLFIILSAAAVMPCQAQFYEVGFWLGASHYFGDLNTTTNLDYPGPSGGLLFRYNANTRWAYTSSLNYGRVSYEDANNKNYYQQIRNLSFRSNIFEFSQRVEFNFFKYKKGDWRYNFTPYLTTGLSVFRYNPQALYQGDWIDLRPIGTEGQNDPTYSGHKKYHQFSMAIPIGGGIKYAMNHHWAFHVEILNHKTYTDYLDDVSTTYYSPTLIYIDPLFAALSDRSGEITGEPIGVNGRQRGDSKKRDDYTFLSIGITYTWRDKRCPKPGGNF